MEQDHRVAVACVLATLDPHLGSCECFVFNTVDTHLPRRFAACISGNILTPVLPSPWSTDVLQFPHAKHRCCAYFMYCYTSVNLLLVAQNPRSKVHELVMPPHQRTAIEHALARRFCLPQTGRKRPVPAATDSGPLVKRRRERGAQGAEGRPQVTEAPDCGLEVDDSMVGLACETTEEHLKRRQGKQWQKRCARCKCPVNLSICCFYL